MIAQQTRVIRRGFIVAQLALGWTAAIGLSPSLAMAQNDSDRATARALAEEGYNALKAQKFEVADDRFRRADALVHAPTLVVDDGRALMGLGRFVEAQERFELVLREPTREEPSPTGTSFPVPLFRDARHAIQGQDPLPPHSAARCATGVALTAGVTGANAAGGKRTPRRSPIRTSPHGHERCEVCTSFLPPDQCRTVVGPVGRQAWCNIYAGP